MQSREGGGERGEGEGEGEHRDFLLCVVDFSSLEFPQLPKNYIIVCDWRFHHSTSDDSYTSRLH